MNRKFDQCVSQNDVTTRLIEFVCRTDSEEWVWINYMAEGKGIIGHSVHTLQNLLWRDTETFNLHISQYNPKVQLSAKTMMQLAKI